MRKPRPVILTAGRATRAAHRAPDGCKALVALDNRPVIAWQLDVLGPEDPIIVCRYEHAAMLDAYGEVVINDAGRGAADALASALLLVEGPVTVAYADTFFSAVPDGTDWVGTSIAEGGRKWDVVRDGYVAYEHVPAEWLAKVHVGLCSFSDPQRLLGIIERLTSRNIVSQPEMGLGPALNVYQPWREERIDSWADVGDVAAIESWRAA